MNKKKFIVILSVVSTLLIGGTASFACTRNVSAQAVTTQAIEGTKEDTESKDANTEVNQVIPEANDQKVESTDAAASKVSNEATKGNTEVNTEVNDQKAESTNTAVPETSNEATVNSGENEAKSTNNCTNSCANTSDNTCSTDCTNSENNCSNSCANGSDNKCNTDCTNSANGCTSAENQCSNVKVIEGQNSFNGKGTCQGTCPTQQMIQSCLNKK
ncbi:hypothetical protein [Clostridium sp. ZBS2]|uniref:hypothetical protein n=1 Tax=Clostridium sp. ZBS2 TaxID=2949976 RepID=UPI0020794A7B|nr:hypothetical protein [Clostridium sp. ZBS2]